jgi:hypothetical protein
MLAHQRLGSALVARIIPSPVLATPHACAVLARFSLLAKQRQIGTAAARRPLNAKWKLQDAGARAVEVRFSERSGQEIAPDV